MSPALGQPGVDSSGKVAGAEEGRVRVRLLEAFKNLRNLPDVDPQLIDDILDANPRAFYGI